MKYKDWSPTGFDSPGAFLPDRQEWEVVPVCRTRDSGPRKQSNFQAALTILKRGPGLEIHRFGHWGPGWVEIILISPTSRKRLEKLKEIVSCLENYPLLDDEDYCRREQEEYDRAWNDWGWKDFVRALSKRFDLSDEAKERLEEVDKDALRKLYEGCLPSGDFFISEDGGVTLRIKQAAATAEWKAVSELIGCNWGVSHCCVCHAMRPFDLDCGVCGNQPDPDKMETCT